MSNTYITPPQYVLLEAFHRAGTKLSLRAVSLPQVFEHGVMGCLEPRQLRQNVRTALLTKGYLEKAGSRAREPRYQVTELGLKILGQLPSSAAAVQTAVYAHQRYIKVMKDEDTNNREYNLARREVTLAIREAYPHINASLVLQAMPYLGKSLEDTARLVYRGAAF